MKKKIKKIAANPLISGSVLIFSGGLIASFLNFLFNLFMSWNLSLADYGSLISVISLILLAVIPASAVVPTIVSTAGHFFAEDDNASLKSLYIKILKPIFFFGLIFFIFSSIFINQIGNYLHIQNLYVLFVMILSIVIGYIATVNTGFLQAKLSFNLISLSNIISSIIKLGVGVPLVFLGLGFLGGLNSFALSMLVPIFIGFYALRKILLIDHKKRTLVSYKQLFSYGIPSSIAIFSINAFITSDIILVKHFFSPDKAGLFAGLSLIGKVIFFLSAPISSTMFPIIIRKFNKKENYNQIFLLSLALVLVISLPILFFYFIFPEFTILFFLKNTHYLELMPFLVAYGMNILLYTLLSCVMYFFLSINKTKVCYLLAVGAILQFVLISIFHRNFTEVIASSITVLSLLLLVLLIYYCIYRITENGKKEGS